MKIFILLLSLMSAGVATADTPAVVGLWRDVRTNEILMIDALLKLRSCNQALACGSVFAVLSEDKILGGYVVEYFQNRIGNLIYWLVKVPYVHSVSPNELTFSVDGLTRAHYQRISQ